MTSWARFVVKLLLKELSEYEKYNKYKNGKIYRIVNSVDNKVYIGWTNTHLRDRWAKHRYEHKNRSDISGTQLHLHFRKLGIEKFHIELVELWPTKGSYQIHMREYTRQVEVPEDLRLHVPGKPLPPEWSTSMKTRYCILMKRRRERYLLALEKGDTPRTAK